jgi:hypothetical protein
MTHEDRTDGLSGNVRTELPLYAALNPRGVWTPFISRPKPEVMNVQKYFPLPGEFSDGVVREIAPGHLVQICKVR